jgi:DHA1 family multidrug resistance protein-like MFS transporter
LPSWFPSRPRFRPLEPWERAQYLVILTVLLAHVAFDLTQPFIPLYVRYLGVTDLAEAAFWSGLIVGMSPLCGALMGPVWGSMADRFGRKVMVLRALVLISLLQFAQAAVPDVGWLFWTRIVMGIFAGFTPMSMALAISLGPRDKMGRAIGMVQAAQFLPLAFGPPIGGLISDNFGLRANFMLTGCLLIIPALLLFFLVKENVYEPPKERASSASTAQKPSFFTLLSLPGFAAALSILFLARFTDRALPAILPLYLVELNTPDAQLATVTGLVVSGGAIAAAASSMVYGQLSQPRTMRKLLMLALFGGALCSAPIALASSWSEVLGLRVLLGLLAGGAMSLAYTLGARMAPAERSGLTLSVLGSCGQLGGAISPMLAGLISQYSLKAVFVGNSVAFLVAFGMAGVLAAARERVARERAAAAQADR